MGAPLEDIIELRAPWQSNLCLGSFNHLSRHATLTAHTGQKEGINFTHNTIPLPEGSLHSLDLRSWSLS